MLTNWAPPSKVRVDRRLDRRLSSYHSERIGHKGHGSAAVPAWPLEGVSHMGASASLPAPEPRSRASQSGGHVVVEEAEAASKDQERQSNRAAQESPGGTRQQRASVHAARLRWARERGLRALQEDERQDTTADWRERLLPAGKQLLAALDAFLLDEDLWDGFRIDESVVAFFDSQKRLQMQEVFNQDLAALLVYMGYRPPPPAERLETDLKESLADILESPPGDTLRAMLTRRAESMLAIVTHRLRRVINDAEQDQTSDRPRLRSSAGSGRAGLRSAIAQGAAVAVPAALAAAAVTLVFPPAGPAAQAAGFTMAAGASGQELLKQAIQLGGTDVLNRVLARETAAMDTNEQFLGAIKRANAALLDLSSVLSDRGGRPNEHISRWLKAQCIESMSSLYGLLQATLDLEGIAQRAVRGAADDLFLALHEVQELIADPSANGNASSQAADKVLGKWQGLMALLNEGGRASQLLAPNR
jgi:hypothetical protein